VIMLERQTTTVFLSWAIVLAVAVWTDAEAATDPWPVQILGSTKVVSARNAGNLAELIRQANTAGGTLILNPDVPKGPLPAVPSRNTRIVDLRYQGGINMTRGNHPRLEGYWPQYSSLGTGLARNLIISDVLPFDTLVESWKSEPRSANPKNVNIAQDSHEYSNTHNHYQNFLSEVWSFSPTVNAVALWGDSGAFHPGAKSWGGFLSARSWPVHWKEYVPPGTPSFADRDFDAQLVGLEIDVLNGGLDEGRTSGTIGMPLSKSGLQIVGFGKRNTAAVEIRTEDSDDVKKAPDDRKGTWRYGVIAYNALNSDSTFLFSATPKARTGLDLSMTDHSDGAIKIKSEGNKSGIALNEGHGGQLFAQDNELIIRFGDQGFSLSAPGGREVIHVGRWGMIRWNGVNLVAVGLLFLAVNLWLVVAVLRQRAAIARLTAIY
jgi:hypothetical protein